MAYLTPVNMQDSPTLREAGFRASTKIEVFYLPVSACCRLAPRLRFSEVVLEYDPPLPLIVNVSCTDSCGPKVIQDD